MASGAQDGSIAIWGVEFHENNGYPSLEVKLEQYFSSRKTKFTEINVLNWANTSDDFIVISGKEMGASIIDVTSGKAVLKFDGHVKPIMNAHFSRDDSKLFTISTD